MSKKFGWLFALMASLTLVSAYAADEADDSSSQDEIVSVEDEVMEEVEE